MSTGCVRWEWLDDFGWIPYSKKHGQRIEDAYENGECYNFKMGKREYAVHTDRMCQSNAHTGFERKIRRVNKDGSKTTTPKSKGPPTKKTKYSTTIKKKSKKYTSSLSSSSTSSSSSSSLKLPIMLTYDCPKSKTIDVKALTKYSVLTEPKEELKNDCDICMCKLFNDDDTPVKLEHCIGHGFHLKCLEKAFEFSQKCPVCSYTYLLRGPQPSGTMQVEIQHYMCAGYSGSNTIVIQYYFRNGKQSFMHPSPGKRFSGTSRTAYLPDTAEGRRVCKLLMRGFQHGLLFTVGQSITTGQKDTTIWNGIHHKTSTSGGVSNWGYPDEGYFTRVTNELASKGLYCEEFVAAEKKAHEGWKLKRQKSAEEKKKLDEAVPTEKQIDSMKLTELQKHLTALGLDVNGTKTVLRSRLQAHMKSSASEDDCSHKCKKKKVPDRTISSTLKKINEELVVAMREGNRPRIKELMAERAKLKKMGRG